MCLITFAPGAHPDYAFVLAANRDEFYDRPTAPAHFWSGEGEGNLLAGRDERAGGTWMGLTRGGRFAALTNVRGTEGARADAPSRGTLVTAFLQDDGPPLAFLDALAGSGDRYAGFNLLVGTFGDLASSSEEGEAASRARLAYFSNRSDAPPQAVAPGVHGLSNAALDTAWPKVQTSKAALGRLLAEGDVAPGALLSLLHDADPAPVEALPDTGVPRAWERALSSVFIQTDGYGTRSSTALLVGWAGGVTFVERSFEEGTAPRDRHYAFQIEPE